MSLGDGLARMRRCVCVCVCAREDSQWYTAVMKDMMVTRCECGDVDDVQSVSWSGCLCVHCAFILQHFSVLVEYLAEGVLYLQCTFLTGSI